MLNPDLKVRLSHLHEPRRTIVAVFQVGLGANHQLTSFRIFTDPANRLMQ